MTVRDPERTREALLDAAYREIYRNGFQGTGLEAILARARVTKGALYHHFASKMDLGYAVVDEVIRGWFQKLWNDPLGAAGDPVDTLQAVLANVAREVPDEARDLGCPLNNLAQEMSPLDEGFRIRIQSIYRAWQGAVAGALRRGQQSGCVRPDLDVEASAAMIVAAFEGAFGLGKTSQEPGASGTAMRGLINYLDGLRAAREGAA